MAKFLITGGAGFIGSNYLNLMVNKYPEDFYVCLDLLTYAGNLESLKFIKDKPNFKFVKGDITNKEFIDELFKKEKFDYVINFAAESHVDRSLKNPDIFYKTNILGVANLMDASLKYNVKRFHQVSTDEVYGDLALDSEYAFKESDFLNPSSPYSASKASADLLCLAYKRTFDLDVTISRCTNNYGPYQLLEKLIPLMILRAKNHEELPIYGAGTNIRDWLYVDDHSLAIDLIVRNGKKGEIYNVSADDGFSNLEVVKMILDYFKLDETNIKFIKDRPGHDLKYAISSSKIKEELGWEKSINFKEGIFKTIKWYLENEEWIKSSFNKDFLKFMNEHY